MATSQAKFEFAQQCLYEAQGHCDLLLLATAAGNADMVARLGLQADQAGKHNVSFFSSFFARTYLPSEISRVVEM
jgi:coatomer subunit beta'